jgi:hypothetical protein
LGKGVPPPELGRSDLRCNHKNCQQTPLWWNFATGFDAFRKLPYQSLAGFGGIPKADAYGFAYFRPRRDLMIRGIQ